MERRDIMRIGMNAETMKQMNRMSALRRIATEGEVMRLTLAESLGLTRMSLTNVVNDLISNGYIEEKPAYGDHKVGRNPIPLSIAKTAPKSIGIWISRDHIAMAVCDMTLQVLYTGKIDLYRETEETIQQKLLALAEEAVPYSQPAMGIGIAMIGAIDPEAEELVHPKNFFGIERLNVKDILQDRFPLPVYVNNDMNCAALAESMYGRYRRYQNMLYIGLDNGVGAGIIHQGQLMQGGHVGIGEIGHMSIECTGERCACGNRGCLENYVSIPVLEKQFAQAGPRFKDHCALPENSAVMEGAAEYLVVAMVNLVNILHPDIILMGHQGSFIPKYLLTFMEEKVNFLRFTDAEKPLRVRHAHFGEIAPLLGGAALVYDAFFRKGKCTC